MHAFPNRKPPERRSNLRERCQLLVSMKHDDAFLSAFEAVGPITKTAGKSGWHCLEYGGMRGVTGAPSHNTFPKSSSYYHMYHLLSDSKPAQSA